MALLFRCLSPFSFGKKVRKIIEKNFAKLKASIDGGCATISEEYRAWVQEILHTIHSEFNNADPALMAKLDPIINFPNSVLAGQYLAPKVTELAAEAALQAVE